jgi:cytochrome P450
MLPFWIMADHLYGTLESAQELELERLIPVREALFARCIQGGITRSSWSQYLPTKTNRSLRDFRWKWQCFNDAVYSTHKADGKNTIITELYQAVQDGRINSENLHQTLDEMLFANLDVTMGAISWNVMFLADHQDVQDRVRDELRNASSMLCSGIGSSQIPRRFHSSSSGPNPPDC